MFSWCNHLKSHSVFFWESFFLTALWKVTSVVLQGYFSVTCLLQTHGLTTWDCCYCLPLGSCVLVSDRDRVTRVKRNIPFDFFLTANLAVNIANKRCRTFCLSVHLVVPQWFACCALEWGCERQLPGQVSRWRGIQLCDLLWKLFVHPKKKKKTAQKHEPKEEHAPGALHHKAATAPLEYFSEVSLCVTGGPAELPLLLYFSFFGGRCRIHHFLRSFSAALLDSAEILAAPTLLYKRTVLQNRPWDVCFAFDILDS